MSTPPVSSMPSKPALYIQVISYLYYRGGLLISPSSVLLLQCFPSIKPGLPLKQKRIPLHHTQSHALRHNTAVVKSLRSNRKLLGISKDPAPGRPNLQQRARVTAAFRQKITNLPNFPGIPSKANDTHPSTIHSLSPSYPKDTKPLKQQTLKVETTNATIDLPEPGNIELKPGIMITRTFVVIDEDLDAHEADLSRGLIEGGYEVDEGRVDRGAVPSKARTVLGIPPPVHPASSPGW